LGTALVVLIVILLLKRPKEEEIEEEEISELDMEGRIFSDEDD
jgi:hypothetical protein